jgi:hypothetical protein
MLVVEVTGEREAIEPLGGTAQGPRDGRSYQGAVGELARCIK